MSGCVAPKQMAPAEQFAYVLEFAMLSGLSLSVGAQAPTATTF